MTEAVLAQPRPTRMLAITAAWGSCFVAIDWGLRDAPVLWFAAFRSLLAGAGLVGVASVQHRPARMEPLHGAGSAFSPCST